MSLTGQDYGGERLTPNGVLAAFGHVAASTSGSATFKDVGHDQYLPGVELTVDATVVPAVGRRGKSAEYVDIEFPEPQIPGEMLKPRRLATRIPIWVEGPEASGLRRLFMTLGTSAIDKHVISLAEFAPRLWSRSAQQVGSSDQDSIELLVLDTLAQLLFALAANLHSRNRTIGLLDPANVLFYFNDSAMWISGGSAERTGRRAQSATSSNRHRISGDAPRPNCAQIQILLPDLFLDADAGVTDVPPWISVRENYNFLWGIEQTTGDVAGAGEKDYLDRQVQRCSPEKDIKCLARLFAWALTGKKMAYVPADIVLRGGCWDIIRSVLMPGQAAGISANEVGESLAENPLREHVVPSDPVLPDEENSWGGQLAVLGTLVLLLGVAAYYFWPPHSESPVAAIYSGCPNCDANSVLHTLFQSELTPLVTEYHGDGRYRFPEDGTAVLEPQALDAETLNDQTRLLQEQMAIIQRAQNQLEERPTKDLPSERECLTSEVRKLISRVQQHFDVIDGRTVGSQDGLLSARAMIEVLERLAEVINADESVDLKAGMEEVLSFLQQADTDTKVLFHSDERMRQYFHSAAALYDRVRAKRLLIRHVKHHQIYKLQDAEK